MRMDDVLLSNKRTTCTKCLPRYNYSEACNRELVHIVHSNLTEILVIVVAN